jgi:hypothetical protein
VSLVISLSHKYSSYKNSLVVKKINSSLNLVSFFDFIGKGNDALRGINAIIKGERIPTLNDDSFINPFTSRKIIDISYHLIKSVKDSRGNASSTFPLKTLFAEAERNRITSTDCIKDLTSDIIKAWKNTFSPIQHLQSIQV